MLRAGCSVLGAWRWVLGASRGVLGASRGVLGAWRSVFGASRGVLDAGRSVRGARCCVIGACCWVLATGYAVAGTGPTTLHQAARAQRDVPSNQRDALKAPAQHDVVVDGHHFAVWEKRPAQPRAAILLVHGRTWSSLPNFDLQVPGEKRSFMDALAAAGFDVFALDMRGYGQTPRDASGWLTPDRAVADVAGVIGWMQQRMPPAQRLPVFLFGLSRGAMVAAMTAQQRPEMIAGVVLLGFGFDPDERAAATPTTARPQRLKNTADAAGSDFVTKDAYTPATVNAFVRAALQADPVLVDWRDDNQFNAFKPAQMQVPALLVHGAADPQAPIAVEAKLFTRFGTADKWWVILPGADHAAHLEKSSAELVRAIVTFTRRHEVSVP